MIRTTDQNKLHFIFIVIVSVGLGLIGTILLQKFYHLISKEKLRFVHFTKNETVSRDIAIDFQGSDRYFPQSIIQVTSPEFLWDNFSSYNKKLWGDNLNGDIKTLRLDDGGGQVSLEEHEMIWLLYRLSYGTVEFRWLDLQNAIQDKNSDKYFGFGDPGEGFAAGFRLHSVDRQPVAFYAETVNYGQTHRTLIPWIDDYNRGRFYVDWSKDQIRYSIGGKEFAIVAVHHPKDVRIVGLPTVRMEISVQNLSGSHALILPLMKYDAYEK